MRASILVVLMLSMSVQAQGVTEEAPILLIDAKGKEIKAKKATFVQGTRHLAWLADPKAPIPKAPPVVKGQPAQGPRVGPEYFEIRQGSLFQFKSGIVDLVPMSSIRSIDFDKDKKTISVKVLTKDKDVVLSGSSEYLGINKVQIEAEIDLGALGSARETFKAGDKDGLQSIRFPDPKPAAVHELGKQATVVCKEKDETQSHTVGDLAPIYRLPTGLIKPWPFLYFQKSVKVEFTKIARVRYAQAEDLKLGGSVVEVTLDGASYPLTLIEEPRLAEDLAPPHLVGLVGKTPLGFKLIPLARITDLTYPEK